MDDSLSGIDAPLTLTNPQPSEVKETHVHLSWSDICHMFQSLHFAKWLPPLRWLSPPVKGCWSLGKLLLVKCLFLITKQLMLHELRSSCCELVPTFRTDGLTWTDAYFINWCSSQNKWRLSSVEVMLVLHEGILFSLQGIPVLQQLMLDFQRFCSIHSKWCSSFFVAMLLRLQTRLVTWSDTCVTSVPH